MSYAPPKGVILREIIIPHNADIDEIKYRGNAKEVKLFLTTLRASRHSK